MHELLLSMMRHPSWACMLLIALSALSDQYVHVHGFEVPFPQSAAEIRASAVLSTVEDPSRASLLTQSKLLGSGTKAEVISCLPPSKDRGGGGFLDSLFGSPGDDAAKGKHDKPVLAFLHGSFHASWCWSEKYMPYFAQLGYPCVAFSLQGTGGTPAVEEGATKVKMESHVADLDAFLNGLSDEHVNALGLGLGTNPPIVLLGHSFGGLTIMKWLEHHYRDDDRRSVNLAGVSLLCSVPPSGNGPMTLRFLRRSLRDSWKITAGFVMKKAITDKEICRDLFFGGNGGQNGITDEDLDRYQSYFRRDTAATIDLADLAKRLPSMKADKNSGRSPFADELPPSLVIAAKDDFVVDEVASRETANYLGVEPPTIVDSPHDVMLGDKWKNGADAILEWIQTSC